MEKIGEKIKRLRNEGGLSQENLAPTAQSQLSQIEGGSISNPNTLTLKKYASGFNMTFDELIENTDWKSPEKALEIQYYAISENDFIVELNDRGIIDITRKTYPLENSNGELNKFCPKTGTPLITECSNCKRKIEDKRNKFCMGCGNQLVREIDVLSQVYDLASKDFIQKDKIFVDPNVIDHTIKQLTRLNVDLSSDCDIIEDLLSEFEPLKYEKDFFIKFGLDTKNDIKYFFTHEKLDKKKIIKQLDFNADNCVIVMGLIDCIKNKRDSSPPPEPVDTKEKFQAEMYGWILSCVDGLNNPGLMKISDESYNVEEQLTILKELAKFIDKPVEELEEFISGPAADKIKSAVEKKDSTEKENGERSTNKSKTNKKG